MSLNLEAPPPIRVLIVDDSAFMRTALRRMIASEAGIEVVGTAHCATDAIDKIANLDPDVVTLDIEMPGLDGLATLRLILRQFPRPVIMVSGTTEKNAESTFAALGAGAFDYVPKQLSATSLDIFHIRDDLIAKIHAAAQSRRSRPALPHAHKPPRSTLPEVCASAAPEIVAIGVSTGGPQALQKILPRFPREFPLPILIVQHMPLGFTAPFAQRLKGLCSIDVHEATQRELIRPGVAYIAPAGLHMRIMRRLSDSRFLISLDPHPEDALHIPSVDIMMISIAENFKSRALGVIMTGMGCDGAEGMAAIYRQGGLTIGQDEATCAVYGMPRACAEQRVLSHVLPLSEIPSQIQTATRLRRTHSA